MRWEWGPATNIKFWIYHFIVGKVCHAFHRINLEMKDKPLVVVIRKTLFQQSLCEKCEMIIVLSNERANYHRYMIDTKICLGLEVLFTRY